VLKGNNLTLKQLCIQKTVSSNDSTLVPLTSLNYTMDIQVSGFFDLDEYRITDILSDGHYLKNNQMSINNFNFYYKNNLINNAVLQSDLTFTDNKSNIVTDITGASISDTYSSLLNRYQIDYNLNNLVKSINSSYYSITDPNLNTKVKGGLVYRDNTYADPYPENSDQSVYNYDERNSGGYELKIEYDATIGQVYYGRTANTGSMNNDYNKIDISDYINSSINVSCYNANWESITEEYYESNSVPNELVDDSSTYNNIGSISISKQIYAITRDSVVYDSNSVEELFLQSQDLVTYRVTINLSHQNFRNLSVLDTIPLPIMNVGGISTNINSAFESFIPGSTLPSINKIRYGPSHTFYDSNDNLVYNDPSSISLNTDSNNFTIYWGDFQMPYYTPNNNTINHKIGSKTIDILYTIKATDEPTADGLKLTNQALYNSESTTGSSLSDNDFTSIILSQPVVEILKGAVAVNAVDTNTVISGSSDISATFNTSGFTNNSTVDFDTKLNYTINNLNRGDDVKYCLIVKNTGTDKAFDVKITDDQAILSGSTQNTIDVNSIEVYDGEGNSISISSSEKSKFITTGMNIGDIPGSYTKDGNLVNDDGVNTTESLSMRIVLYKAQLLERTSLIRKNQVVTNKVYVENYANTTSGQNFVNSSQKPSSSYNVSLKNISITRKIIFNSEDHTNTSNRSTDNMTIGEIYRIKSTIEIPLGTINDTKFRDETDFRVNSSNHCGMEVIKSVASLTSGNPLFYNSSNSLISNSSTHISSMYNSTDTNQNSYYYDSSQFRYSKAGKLVNTSIINNVMQPTIIVIEHIGRLTDGSFSSTKYLGQNGITSSHRRNSNSKLALYDNNTNLSTSSSTRINVKEPNISIYKRLDPSSPSNPSKNDTIIYYVDVSVSNYNAYNVILRDVLPQDDITLVEVREDTLSGPLVDLNSIYDPINKEFSINLGTLKNTYKRHFVFATLDNYRTGDLIRNTGIVTYNSLDQSTNYEKPSDGVIDDVTLSKVYRSYQKTDNVDIRTYSSLDFNLNNETYSHEYVSGDISAAIGDTLKSDIVVSIPKGKTYISEIKYQFSSDTNSISSAIPNENLINSADIVFSSGLTYDDNGSNSTTLDIQPYLSNNYVIFPINKLFNNSTTSSATLQFPYDYILKNKSSNIRGTDVVNKLSMTTLNTELSSNTINADTSKIDLVVIEPQISITNILIEEPMRAGDTIKFNVVLTIDGRTDSDFSTVAFNPKFYISLDPTYIDTSTLSLLSTDTDVDLNDWILNNNGSLINMSYEPSNSDNILNNGEYTFEFEFDTTADLLLSEQLNISSTSIWSSQLSYSVDTNIPESYDKVRYFETIEVGDYESRVNNYITDDTTILRVKDSVEKFRYGVAFEDARDFDYDYEDVVLNVIYRYYRNKRGIKRFMADIHMVARGAGYDHTLGISYDGLRVDKYGNTRTGLWNVVQYSGHDNTMKDNSSDILTYLNRNTNATTNLAVLRDDGIPLVISTMNTLPPDSAKPDYGFSTNCHNRTNIITDWVAPTSIRLLIDFDDGSEIKDDEVDGIRKHFIPYIDVRGPKNNKSNPSYDDYEYRHDLTSTVDHSRKNMVHNSITSTFKDFPKVLVTPIDFKNKEDNGGVLGYYRLVDVYTGFIDYVTSNSYPDTSSMKKMELIDERIPEIIDNTSWTNDPNKIISDRLMLTTTEEYENIGLYGILNKEKMNEYHTRNTSLMGPFVYHSGKMRQYIAQTTSQESEQFVINPGTSDTSTIESYLSNNTTKLVTNFNSNSNGCVCLIYDKTSTNPLLGGNIMTSDNVFDQTNNIFTDTSLKFIKSKMVKSNNSSYYNKVVLISTSYTLVTNLSGDHSAHNNNSRIIYDVASSNTEILSIGFDNDLVITGTNSSLFNISGINNAIQVSSSNNGFAVLTTDNEAYYLDNSQNQIQIFSDKTITDIKLSDKYVVIMVKETSVLSSVYAYDIENSLELPIIRTNVMNTNIDSDWIASVLKDGRVVLDLLDTVSGQLPDISTSTSLDSINHIDSINSNDIIVDVYPYNDSVMVFYN